MDVFTGAANSTKVCFVAVTLIITPDHMVAIEDICVGDEVVSTCIDTFEVGVKRVAKTFVRESSWLVHIKVEEDVIHTTPEHLFYVKDVRFVEARLLRKDDRLACSSGDFGVILEVDIELCEEAVVLYNFEVEEYHTYHVGDAGVWVHNADYVDGVNGAKPFDIVKYGDKTPGLENHHGVLDVWAKNNIPGYVGRAKRSTSIALTAGKEGQHAATKAAYRDWLFARTGRKVGGKVDWKNVSQRDMQDLTERMFDAARVPNSARADYYREFNRYIYGLD